MTLPTTSTVVADFRVPLWFSPPLVPEELLSGYHFSGISGNLKISENSAKVREKAQSRRKVTEFVVRKI